MGYRPIKRSGDFMTKKRTRILLLLAAFALFIVPVVAFAAAGFDDVDDDNVFVADIQWMKDNEITKGCNPPSNTNFCPEKAVTRQQMAAFMRRLATNKVVDAATAVNSDKLDGFSSENLAPRAAMVTYEGANTDPAGEVRTTVTIEAPARGILIGEAGGDTYGGTGLQKCYLRIDGSDDLEVDANGWVDHDQDSDADCTARATVVVDAGTHTVDLWFIGDATNDGILTVMWIPFDGEGAVPTPPEPEEPASTLGTRDGR